MIKRSAFAFGTRVRSHLAATSRSSSLPPGDCRDPIHTKLPTLPLIVGSLCILHGRCQGVANETLTRVSFTRTGYVARLPDAVSALRPGNSVWALSEGRGPLSEVR